MAKTKQAENTATNETKVNETSAPTTPVPTSENLTKLQAEYESAGIAMQSEKFNSPAWIDAKTKLFTLESQIKTEEAKIKSDLALAAIQEARNARVKMADDLVNAVLGAVNIAVSPEQAAQFAPQLEIVKNELLAKYAHSTPAKKATKTGESAGTKGATTAAIRELIVPMYAGVTSDMVAEVGKNVRKEIIHTHGFNDGTANAVILAYEKELGLKA